MSDLVNGKWKFQQVAHRGFRAHYAENTLIAFEKALDVGATMLELDVRMTKDEVPVILHDPTLMRLGKHHEHVSNFLWKDLCALELHDARARHVQAGRVLALEELFQAIGDKTNYYLELKTSHHHSVEHAHRLCQLVVQQVEAFGLQKKALIAAFQFHLLQYLRENCHPMTYGYNFEHHWLGVASIEQLKEFDSLILCPKHTLLSKERFDEVKSHGFRIVPWVVNRERRMRELIDWGVDGITSDYPNRLAAIARELHCV